MAKLKLKTKRTAAKRFKVTATGKLMRNRSHGNHLLVGKSRKRKRRLRSEASVATPDRRGVRRCLPYSA